MMTQTYLRTKPLLTLALTLFLVGCGKQPVADGATGQPATTSDKAETAVPSDLPDPGVQVAIIPGANLLLHLDLGDMRNTAVMQAIDEKRVASGTKAPANMNKESWTKLKELTGLTSEDFHTVLVSADINSLNINAKKVEREFKNLDGACAISLAKPLAFSKLLECVQTITADANGPTIEQLKLAGRPVLHIPPSSPNEPTIYVAPSKTEKTILLSFSEAHMQGMLQRDNAGQAATPDPALVRLGSSLADGSQVRMLTLISDAIRAKIGEQIDSYGDTNPHQQQTQRGVIAGFFSPLRSTQSVIVGAKAGEALDLRLAMELGSAPEAQQCAHLIQSFIVPMVTMGIQRIDPENKILIDDTLLTVNEENMLVITASLTREDVENWPQATE